MSMSIKYVFFVKPIENQNFDNLDFDLICKDDITDGIKEIKEKFCLKGDVVVACTSGEKASLETMSAIIDYFNPNVISIHGDLLKSLSDLFKGRISISDNIETILIVTKLDQLDTWVSKMWNLVEVTILKEIHPLKCLEYTEIASLISFIDVEKHIFEPGETFVNMLKIRQIK